MARFWPLSLTWVRGVVPSLLVCLALAGLTGVAAHAERRVDLVLNENWRGAYDILVTPMGQDFGAADTSGLVDASFISTAGQGGITIAEVEATRLLEDVEVAAPLGMVGALRNYAMSPVLWVPDPTKGEDAGGLEPGRVHVFRMSVDVTDTRGKYLRPLARNVGHVALQSEERSQPEGSSDQTASGYPIGFGPLWDESGFFLPLGQLPDFSTAVIAVDPAAEQALLGAERSAFLDGLLEAPRERDLAAAGSSWAGQVDQAQFLGPKTDILNIVDGLAPSRTAVPLVVSEPTEASIEMTVRVEPLLSEVPEVPMSVGAMEDLVREGNFGEPLVEVTADASGVTAPFANPDLLMLWPGTQRPAGEGDILMYQPATDLSTVLIGRPSYQSTGGRSFQVAPLEVTGSAGQDVDPGSMGLFGGEPTVGLTRAYREVATPRGAQSQAGVLPVPLGTFALTDLADPDELAESYVPSGLQPTTPTRIVQGPRSGEVIHPAFSNLDFITSPPGAFTDLDGGAALRGETPVDAVRVRVGGIEAYTPENQERVASVAAQIEELGLVATIVAGSSPQQVSLQVPLHLPSEAGTVWSDLPTVSQEWTTLGAVGVVERALSTASRDLAWAAMVSVGLGLVATSLLNGKGRRAEVSALSLLGWRRSTIRRRLTLRQTPGLALITLTAGACLVWAHPGIRPVVLLLVVLAYGVAAASVALAMGSARKHGNRAGRDRRPVTSLGTYAVRRVTARPLTTALASGGIAVLAIVSGLSVLAWQDNLRSAGATRLAATAIDLTAASILTLGVVGTLSAVILLLTGQRIEMRQRRTQQAALARLGFTPRIRRNLLRREELIMITVTALTGGAAALAICLSVPDPTYAVVAVVAVTLIVVLARQWGTIIDREVNA